MPGVVRRSRTRYTPWAAAVYRYYDSFGALLYVGRSVDPDRRWFEHEANPEATWTNRAVKRVDEWFLTEAEAIEAEAQAIAREDPAANRRPGQHVDGVVSRRGWSYVISSVFGDEARSIATGIADRYRSRPC